MPPVGTPATENPELQLIREWREPITPRRVALAGGGSVVVHIVALVLVTLLLDAPVSIPAPTAPDLRRSVILYTPRDLILTQKDPNKGKVSRDLDVRSAVSAPAPRALPARRPAQVPGPPTVARSFVAPPAPAPPVPAPPPPPKVEPPQIKATATPPSPGVGNTQQSGNGSQALPALPPPSPEKPKLAFESVGGNSGPITPNPNSKIPLPKTKVEEVARAANQSGGGGISVGDTEEPPDLSMMNQPPAPGRVGSNLQLLSDPTGVDFKPYLIQVLAAVRRNWLAVLPQSARMGRPGRVLIQFIIDRSGGVPKLVIATPSGTEAFDRAAVAGISASYPFPPLPADFKGNQIRLQLSFAYNVATR